MDSVSPQGIFISCVSLEFHGPTSGQAPVWPGSYRLAIDHYLGLCGLHTVFQEKFTQAGGDTLEKLDVYIARECKAVIHLIGQSSGSFAKPDELSRLFLRHPDLLHNSPRLREELEAHGYEKISYTQWEVLLAIHHGVKRFVYDLTDAAVVRHPSYLPDPRHAEAQSAHLQRLRRSGIHADKVGDARELIHVLTPALIREGITQGPRPEPISRKHNLPYPTLGTLFKGRADFLRRLADSLAKAPGAQAVFGVGGNGKTRCAVEYAWAHQQEYDAMLFMIADAPEKIDSQLASLAGVLNVAPADARDDVRLAAVLNWLKTHPRWLLIIDNVDSPQARDAVQARLAQLSDGHVLITTRVRDWPAGVTTLSLELLTASDAEALLLDDTSSHRRHRDSDPADAKAVAAAVGYLSLGLVQARAYVSKLRTTYAAYLQSLSQTDSKALDWFDANLMQYHHHGFDHIPRELAAVWQTSVDQLSPHAQQLLDILAWFAPEPIPEQLLDQLPGELAAIESNSRERLLELDALCLAELSDGEAPNFRIHPLIGEVSRRKQLVQSSADEPPTLSNAVAWIKAASQGDLEDPNNWARFRALLPHAIALEEAHGEYGQFDSALLDRCGIASHIFGKYARAEPLMRRLVEGCERQLGSNHPETLSGIHKLAHVLFEKGQLAESEALARTALIGREQLLGPDHPQTLESANNLANVLQGQGRWQEAEAMVRRVKAGCEKVLGSTHPYTLGSVNNLAFLLAQKGDRDEAESLFRQIISDCERLLGEQHPYTLISVNNLADLFEAKGDLAAAEMYHRRSMVDREKVLGPEHPTTLASVNNVAHILHLKRDFAAAEPLYQRALAGREKELGPLHPLTLSSVNSLAGIQESKGDLEQAEQLYRRALRGREQTLGPQHPDTLVSMNNFAVLLDKKGETSAAESYYRRALIGLLQLSQRANRNLPHLDAVVNNYTTFLSKAGRQLNEIELIMIELARDAGIENSGFQLNSKS